MLDRTPTEQEAQGHRRETIWKGYAPERAPVRELDAERGPLGDGAPAHA
ncbi:MAG: hypothetical protein KGJ86_00560 [Chloroflexota bacterium]|nr:hypothetical protein [Chloroflexota bacterium]